MAAAPQAMAQSAAVPREPGTPVADYHAHISSLVIGEASTPPLQPAVQLPPELAALIRARENDADPAVAAQAFREDALLLDTRWPNWVRGREAIELWLSLTTKGLKFRPVEAHTDDRFGYIAGYVIYVDTDGTEYVVRNFLMSLEKMDGRWLIATEAWPDREPPLQKAQTAAEYIEELDAAGIRQGVILSSGFIFGSTPDEADYARVRAENDWVVEQVALYPDRLVAFCGVNPLQSYGVTEVERCAGLPGVRGIKIHFANDGIDLRKPEHAAAVRRIFAAANAAGLHIVAHIATNDSWQDPAVADAQVRAFLSDVLPAATEVTVQVAHMYSDTGWSTDADRVFEQFATAIRTNAPGARNLYFDLSGGPTKANASAENLGRLARRMREVGFDRFLFGSDRSGARNPPPKDALNNVRRLPLTAEEFEDIADNRMPYLP
jgi:predicted TIM-barrel fold metal-dependent hydrolase